MAWQEEKQQQFAASLMKKEEVHWQGHLDCASLTTPVPEAATLGAADPPTG